MSFKGIAVTRNIIIITIYIVLDTAEVLGEGQSSESPKNGSKSPHKSPQRPERPGSAMRNPASARPRTGRLKTARPPSARRPAPRLKEKAEMQASAEEQLIQTRFAYILLKTYAILFI